MSPVLGHVAGSRPAGLFAWLAAITWTVGILGLVAVRPRRFWWVWGTIIVVGVAGSIFDIVERNQSPARPSLIIRMVSPQFRESERITVRLCATTPMGASASVTSGSRWVLVILDGQQVAESHRSTIAFSAYPGKHLVAVYVNSPSHQKYAPPIEFNRVIHVSSAGSIPSVPACPH